MRRSFPGSNGIVLCAHRAGDSRHAGQNAYLASAVQHAELATLQVDLVTSEERLEVVPDVGPLFEETKAFHRMVDLMIGWYVRSLTGPH